MTSAPPSPVLDSRFYFYPPSDELDSTDSLLPLPHGYALPSLSARSRACPWSPSAERRESADWVQLIVMIRAAVV